ncbi:MULTISPECIES: CRISPR-associated protein Cas5 [unclassified Clostridium]|uniref:CRISPR-associated protein Cas5 n=1 Tax=unclassified Clostridium TaxID=2614128 RepID=UPI00207A0802|nr:MULTISPECIES: CRISPR-associated protein Cas5 [unclassified Clostridium]
MCKALMFDLHGKYGFFKNHEQNSVNMTYQFIPKVTLEGLLGAIIGLDGWRQMKEHNGKLEYYEVFKNSKIAITPKTPYFEVFYETINNCTGFENKGGTTANIARQILKNPCYTVILKQDSIEEGYYNKLKEMLFKGESIYRICLGNNRYTANIDSVKEIDLNKVKETKEIIINSLIREDVVNEIYEENEDGIMGYELHISYPTDYNIKSDYGHCKENIIYSNHYIDIDNDLNLYEYNNNIYYFL